MLTYHYTASNPATGQQIKADVQADSEGAAVKLIREQGLTPIDIRLEGSGLIGGLKIGKKVKTKDRVLFSRQLSTLINAGLPLLQALRSVNQQTTSKSLKVILNKIISDIEAGATLSTAMGKHPRVFNQVYVSLIAAGETSGTLDKALDRLAIQQEKDADLVSKVRGALMYPVIVLLVMVLVVGFMVVKVLPQVKIIYDGLPNVSLPLVTRIMLAISDFVIHFWWLVIIVLVFMVFLTTRWARTGPGKEVIDMLKMRAWPDRPAVHEDVHGTIRPHRRYPGSERCTTAADAADNGESGKQCAYKRHHSQAASEKVQRRQVAGGCDRQRPELPAACTEHAEDRRTIRRHGRDACQSGRLLRKRGR